MKREIKNLLLTYGAMSSAGLETTKLSKYDEVNK